LLCRSSLSTAEITGLGISVFAAGPAPHSIMLTVKAKIW
jgi:hypothetical protein